MEGSRLQPGDEDLSQIPFDAIRGQHLVIEETGHEMLKNTPALSVPVLGEGQYRTRDEMLKLLGPSGFVTGNQRQKLYDAAVKLGLDPKRAAIRRSYPVNRLTARARSFNWPRNARGSSCGRDTRQKLTGLFERYGAGVRIAYLETGWNARISRNRGRPDAVPEAAVDRMLGKTVLPMPDEARTVEWLCV